MNTEHFPGSLVTVTSPPIMRASLREGKAEPSTAVAARGQGICLREFLEQFRLLFGGQADAGIGDSKLDPVAAVRHLAHPKGDLTNWRK